MSIIAKTMLFYTEKIMTVNCVIVSLTVSCLIVYDLRVIVAVVMSDFGGGGAAVHYKAWVCKLL